MAQSLSHVAMTVPRALFTEAYLDRLRAFYGELLGWHELPALSIPGERLFIQLPRSDQYLNVRASDRPMGVSGYEHIGVLMDTQAEVRDLHAGIRARADALDDLECDPDVREAYGGNVLTFRFRYLMPLSIEVQYLSMMPSESVT